jgi:medium-chain acyl-[acyl-carrier-protein] hydrolase
MALQKFEKEYRIHIYETGPDGKVNLFSLFNYMQDIASEHAVRLGFGRDDLMKENQFWVLSRMFVVIREKPSWEEKVIVRTWPAGIDSIFAMRNYEILFSDGKVIASASSLWLIVDRTTKKIQRPGDSFARYNPGNNPAVLPVRSPEKLAGLPDKGEIVSRFRVRLSDLDVNLHTNNANYLKWVYNTYDLNFVMHHHPCSAEINYLAESMFDDEIIIRMSGEETRGEGFKNHSVSRKGDNKELCRIRLEWKEKDS